MALFNWIIVCSSLVVLQSNPAWSAPPSPVDGHTIARDAIGVISTLVDSSRFEAALAMVDSGANESVFAPHIADSLRERLFYRWGIELAEQADYGTASLKLKSAVELRRRRLGDDHLDLSYIYHALGNVHNWSGDFSEAEKYYRLALNIRRNHLGQDHYLVAANIHNLALLAFSRGDHDEAEYLCQEALRIREKVLEPGNREIEKSLSGLGRILIARARHAEAVPLLRRAVQIALDKIGRASKAYLEDNIDLAEALIGCGQLDECKESLDSVESIGRRKYGPCAPTVLRSARLRAHLSLLNGDTTLALNSLCETSRQWESCDNVHNPEYALCLESIRDIFYANEMHDSALHYARHTVQICRENFSLNAAVLPQSQALSYAGRLHDVSDQLIQITGANKIESYDCNKIVAETIVNAKGLVLDLAGLQLTQTRTIDDSLGMSIRRRITQVDNQIAILYYQDRREHGLRDSLDLDSLTRLSRDLRGELLTLYAGKINGHLLRPFDIRDLHDHLLDGAIFVEFYRVDDAKTGLGGSPARYFAVVVQPGIEFNLVDLGPAAPIDSTVAALDRNVRDYIETAPADTAFEYQESPYHQLYRQILAPLGVSAPDASRVMLIAPDASLNRVPFAALIDDGGRYLIEDVSITYLTSARDLLMRRDVPPASGIMIAVGDPNFNADVSVSPQLAANNKGYESTSDYRSTLGECALPSRQTFSQLPGSGREIDMAAVRWLNRAEGGVERLTFNDATETNFKQRAVGAEVIYIATHGYQVDPDCFDNATSATPRRVYSGKMNPLLHSGLVFAGANLRDSELRGLRLDDGYLSAYEVAGMDLSAARTVVLSACESGLGLMVRGEGLLGLQRSFISAGASTVVSTLWPVSDITAAELMDGMIERSSTPVHERLRSAQLSYLHRRRTAGQSDHPANWAAYKITGDWR